MARSRGRRCAASEPIASSRAAANRAAVLLSSSTHASSCTSAGPGSKHSRTSLRLVQQPFNQSINH